MNQPDENAPPQKMRLTLQQCKEILRMQTSLFVILAAVAIYQLCERHFLFAAFLLVGVLSQALRFPALWKQYRLVKDGAVIYSKAQHQLQMPQIVSIIAVVLVTVFVGLCSAFVLYLVYTYFNTQFGWTICGLTVLAVWLFVAYCWYRIFTEKPQAKPVLLQEQPEGVWPPPPTLASDNEHPEKKS